MYQGVATRNAPTTREILAHRTGSRPNFAFTAFSEVRPEGFSEVGMAHHAFTLSFFSTSVVLRPGEGLGRTLPGNGGGGEAFRRKGACVSRPKGEPERPKRNDGPPAADAPRPVAGIPIPELSGLLSGLTERPSRLPFYGNYCGPGHGDPTYETPPVDAVDLACREHNRCYALLGGFDSRCDRRFVELLPTAIAETPSQEGKKAGLLALLYFSLAEPNLGLGEILFEGD